MKKCIALVLTLLLVFSLTSSFALSRDFTSVRINEFMASNGDTLNASDGEDYDWIELYNTSDEDIDLEGLCLSDGKKTLDKFVFPKGVTLKANAYMIIFASGTEKITTLENGDIEICVPYKLSSAGEKVVLSYQEEIFDMVRFDQQQKDVSYARKDDNTWAFCLTPTPGAVNVFE